MCSSALRPGRVEPQPLLFLWECGAAGGVWYLLDSAQLVHGALVVLHAVLSQVQVGRVLGTQERSPLQCWQQLRVPVPPATARAELPPPAPRAGSVTEHTMSPPRTLLSSFWYCGIFFSIWDRSLMVVCEGRGHGHSPSATWGHQHRGDDPAKDFCPHVSPPWGSGGT